MKAEDSNFTRVDHGPHIRFANSNNGTGENNHMIIELLTLKITMDAILQHLNSLAREQELRERSRMLKSRMLQLITDFEMGAIDQETYSKNEAEIIAELGKITQQITGNGNSSSSAGPVDIGL